MKQYALTDEGRTLAEQIINDDPEVLIQLTVRKPSLFEKSLMNLKKCVKDQSRREQAIRRLVELVRPGVVNGSN